MGSKRANHFQTDISRAQYEYWSHIDVRASCFGQPVPASLAFLFGAPSTANSRYARKVSSLGAHLSLREYVVFETLHLKFEVHDIVADIQPALRPFANGAAILCFTDSVFFPTMMYSINVLHQVLGNKTKTITLAFSLSFAWQVSASASHVCISTPETVKSMRQQVSGTSAGKA
jgi:hypothetical protein